MNKQVLAEIEIETFVVSASAPLDKPGQPVSEDTGAYSSKRTTCGRSALGWFLDTLALAGWAGRGMAGVYVGVWLDPPDAAPPPPRLGAADEKGVSR
jgi:hypothetical protein